MINCIRAWLASHCGYRVIASNDRWAVVAGNSQTVLVFDTKQQAVESGKIVAAKERTQISWTNDDGLQYGVDYRKKGISSATTQLLCALLGRKHQP